MSPASPSASAPSAAHRLWGRTKYSFVHLQWLDALGRTRAIHALSLVAAVWLIWSETGWGWGPLRHSPDVCAGIALAGVAGLALRTPMRKSRGVRLAINGVVLLAVVSLAAAWFMPAIEAEPGRPWQDVFAHVVAGGLPLLFFGFIALSRKKRFTFVLGFGVATMLHDWYVGPAHIALAVFLLLRDVGTPVNIRGRQHVALMGAGLLCGTCAFALSFDMAATLASDVSLARFGRQAGFVGDATLPRWSRMLTEAACVLACLAHSKGRTWGVLLLALALPVLLAQLAASGIHLPWWTSGGCFSAGHPLRDAEYAALAAAVAIGPWLVPMARLMLRRESRLVNADRAPSTRSPLRQS